MLYVLLFNALCFGLLFFCLRHELRWTNQIIFAMQDTVMGQLEVLRVISDGQHDEILRRLEEVEEKLKYLINE